MCLAFDTERLSGVCGSPTNSLEAFTLSGENVRALTTFNPLYSMHTVD